MAEYWNYNPSDAQQDQDAPWNFLNPEPPYTPPDPPAPAPTASGGGSSHYGSDGDIAFRKATFDWANRLQQPVQNPDFQPMVDYLRKYFQQLQGPAYTPAQMELMQTQSLQPLEEQRAAARQQVIQRLAAKGINPGSGVVEKALQEVDHSFNQQRTQTQAGFATNAINLDRQNAASAAAVGQNLAGIQNQQQQLNEGRGLQAVNLLAALPQLDNQTQALAQSWLGQYNPMAGMGYGLQAQQQNNQNSQAYWMNILQSLVPLVS